MNLKTEVFRLSTPERLEAMELLWAALSKDPTQVESPAWHVRVLAGRQAKVDAGEAQFLTIDQLKKRLRR
ncbi:MAG TPA: addiction module protein [Chthoniobacterales bacterium]|nr:addiction module protein [Chthoniobacterales bacterium]